MLWKYGVLAMILQMSDRAGLLDEVSVQLAMDYQVRWNQKVGTLAEELKGSDLGSASPPPPPPSAKKRRGA